MGWSVDSVVVGPFHATSCFVGTAMLEEHVESFKLIIHTSCKQLCAQSMSNTHQWHHCYTVLQSICHFVHACIAPLTWIQHGIPFTLTLETWHGENWSMGFSQFTVSFYETEFKLWKEKTPSVYFTSLNIFLTQLIVWSHFVSETIH